MSVCWEALMEMRDHGCEPNVVSYNIIIAIYAKAPPGRSLPPR
jgi:hypothetical protein